MANELALTIDPTVLSKLGVDFKVTKQDLVELIVAQLEEQLDVMEADHKLRQNKARKACTPHNELTADQHAMLKAKIASNPEAKAFVTQYNKFMQKFTDSGFVGPKDQELAFEPFNLTFHNIEHPQKKWHYCGKSVSVNFRSHPIPSLQRIVLYTPEEMEASMQELTALSNEERQLADARKNLEKKAKTAKLSIVKAALMNSEEGAKLLEVLDKKAAVLKLTPVTEEK